MITRIALALLLLGTPAAALEIAEPEARTRLGAALRNLGYTGFGAIQGEDGFWKVRHARAGDGRHYTLTVEPDTLRILYREPEAGDAPPCPARTRPPPRRPAPPARARRTPPLPSRPGPPGAPRQE
ncbi:hypothetical protein ACFFMP_11815 [Pseudoroseomonas cervicalis]|uniref:hypothetical protein n=1 Tax=Teichococcus cervicalis TaxID=204525 RepID=UPI0035F0D060